MPIAVGTRYQARWKRSPLLVIECVRYERPRGWTNKNGGPLEVTSDFSLEPSDGGAVLRSRFDARAHGLMTIVFPIFVRMLRRQFSRNLAEIKRLLESTTDVGTRG